jgi:hypothetical protein
MSWTIRLHRTPAKRTQKPDQPPPQHPGCLGQHQQESNMAKHNASLYRALHKLRKGGLHKALGVPQNENIPADKLEEAKNSKSDHVRHMAQFAHTMKGFKK